MNEYTYPSQYELREVLFSIADRKFLNQFAQRRGIFLTNCSKQQLAEELSSLFYEENDLEEIRKEAYSIGSNRTLNAFVIKSKHKKFSLKDSYESLRENGKAGTDVRPSTLIQTANSEPEIKETYRGSIEYVKKKVGRMEFLQHETSSFDFYLKKKDDGEWLVEVDCAKSADAKEFRKLLESNLDKSSTEFDSIEQDTINATNLILFFDCLAKSGMGEEWTCLDVKHVTIRKGKDEGIDDGAFETMEPVDEDDDSEPTEIDINKEELIEIRQAILSGSNLRENSVVKQFEGNGYQFTAMTFEFEHKKDPFVIQIKADFKGRPKVFEVGIKSYEEKTGLGAHRKAAILGGSENHRIRSMFWNNAKIIYDTLA